MVINCYYHRYYLLIFLLFCFYVLYTLKTDVSTANSYLPLIDNDSLFERLTYTLDCTGDPLGQWCQNQIHLCGASLIVFDRLFARTTSIILQMQYATSQRKGGEDLQDVLNQAENSEYFQFRKQFIQLTCDQLLPKDLFIDSHLSSIFSTVSIFGKKRSSIAVNHTTIAVNRYDYVNFYHTITDVYTVYLLCRFFQNDPKAVRILFLDSHPKGNLDLLWSILFHSYTRLGHLNGSSIFYKELIWSPPQSKSELDVNQYRRVAPSYFFSFQQHVLEEFNVRDKTNRTFTCHEINIFFLVRHNYIAHPRNPTGTIQRQLRNESEILNELKLKFQKYSSIIFTYNHFEELPMQQQLSIISNTDIFIGMHGAGLTHVLFMKSNRTLIELATMAWKKQTHFEQMASINNINYHRCLIRNQDMTTTKTIFNCVIKQLFQMCPSFQL